MAKRLLHWKGACAPECEFTSTHATRTFSIKIFDGNRVTDEPEFHECGKTRATLSRFLRDLDSRWHLIKVDLMGTEDPLLRALRERARAAALAFVPVEFGARETPCNMSVLRVSGRRWRFPFHFDSGMQVVVHLQGVKRWSWKEEAKEPGAAARVHTLLAQPGDVLFLPAGVWHETENLTPCVMLNYGWPCDASAELAAQFATQYAERARIVFTVGDG